jgi:uncharacterized hydrophobic protein (TIGR00341 family)
VPPRLIEVFAEPARMDAVMGIARHFEALDIRKEPASSGGTEVCRILARPEKQQELIDRLQGALGKEGTWRITIMPVEATIPPLEPSEQEKRSPEQATREELYAEVDSEARINSTFLLLVLLSTVVAVIGLLESNVAIIIAAMLIAPLLGPNMAMALGSTLGDRELILRATATNAVGIGLGIACAAAAGFVLPFDGTSVELMARTRLGYDNILLALASGAAGALSLTTRLPSILVGVMVAVALLPPAVTLGYMLGAARLELAGGAAALLAINVVCVNLAAQIVFIAKGIKPRTWIERRAAQESIRIGLAVTGFLLVVLIAIVAWRQR